MFIDKSGVICTSSIPHRLMTQKVIYSFLPPPLTVSSFTQENEILCLDQLSVYPFSSYHSQIIRQN